MKRSSFLTLLACAVIALNCGDNGNAPQQSTTGSDAATSADAGGTGGTGGTEVSDGSSNGTTSDSSGVGSTGGTGGTGGMSTDGGAGATGGTDDANGTGGSVPPTNTGFDLNQLETGLHEQATRYLAAADEGAQAMPIQNDPRPAFGEWYTSPFNTRLTALSPEANSNHAYSQLQAFSSDSVFVLLAEDIPGSPSALNVIRRMSDRATVLSSPTGLWGNPRWDPASPSKLIHFNPKNSGELLVQRTDVLTGATETAFTFPAEYQSYLTNQSFDELSRDGRWMAGQALGTGNWSRIFAVDLVNQTLGAQLDPEALYAGPCTPDPEWGELDPDWVGVSPLGTYLVVQWATDGTGRCEGLETYDIATGEYVGHVTSGHPHADLTVLADGITEVFVTNELYGPTAEQSWVGGASVQPMDTENPALAYRVLPGPATGEASPHFLYLIDWGGFEHISCRGPIGTCVVTGYPSPENGSLDPLEDEIYLIRLDGTGVVRLAHHHSTGSDYWTQPRASISLDGRYVIFDTDWGLQDQSLAFVIDLANVPTP